MFFAPLCSTLTDEILYPHCSIAFQENSWHRGGTLRMAYNKYSMSWIWLLFKKRRLKENFLRTKVPSRLLQRKGDQFVLSFSKDKDAVGLKMKLIRFTLNIVGETPPLSNRKDNETLEQITKVLLKHPTQRKEKTHTVSSRTSGNCLILLIPYIY